MTTDRGLGDPSNDISNAVLVCLLDFLGHPLVPLLYKRLTQPQQSGRITRRNRYFTQGILLSGFDNGTDRKSSSTQSNYRTFRTVQNNYICISRVIIYDIDLDLLAFSPAIEILTLCMWPFNVQKIRQLFHFLGQKLATASYRFSWKPSRRWNKNNNKELLNHFQCSVMIIFTVFLRDCTCAN